MTIRAWSWLEGEKHHDIVCRLMVAARKLHFTTVSRNIPAPMEVDPGHYYITSLLFFFFFFKGHQCAAVTVDKYLRTRTFLIYFHWIYSSQTQFVFTQEPEDCFKMSSMLYTYAGVHKISHSQMLNERFCTSTWTSVSLWHIHIYEPTTLRAFFSWNETILWLWT